MFKLIVDHIKVHTNKQACAPIEVLSYNFVRSALLRSMVIVCSLYFSRGRPNDSLGSDSLNWREQSSEQSQQKGVFPLVFDVYGEFLHKGILKCMVAYKISIYNYLGIK